MDISLLSWYVLFSKSAKSENWFSFCCFVRLLLCTIHLLKRTFLCFFFYWVFVSSTLKDLNLKLASTCRWIFITYGSCSFGWVVFGIVFFLQCSTWKGLDQNGAHRKRATLLEGEGANRKRIKTINVWNELKLGHECVHFVCFSSLPSSHSATPRFQTIYDSFSTCFSFILFGLHVRIVTAIRFLVLFYPRDVRPFATFGSHNNWRVYGRLHNQRVNKLV